MNIGYSQQTNAFKITGEISSNQRCTISGKTDISIYTTVEEMNNKRLTDWEYGDLSLSNCDLNIEGGRKYSGMDWGASPNPSASLNHDYWGVTSDDYLGVGIEFYLGEYSQVTPSRGMDPNMPPVSTSFDEQGSTKIKTKARLVKLGVRTETTVLSGVLNAQIIVNGTFR